MLPLLDMSICPFMKSCPIGSNNNKDETKDFVMPKLHELKKQL